MKISLILAIIFSASIFFGFNSNRFEDPEGKTIFVNSKCGTCHSVEAAGLTGKSKKSVDLSEAGKSLKKEMIRKYLTNEEKINGKKHPSKFKGTEEELGKLTEWLTGLENKKLKE